MAEEKVNGNTGLNSLSARVVLFIALSISGATGTLSITSQQNTFTHSEAEAAFSLRDERISDIRKKLEKVERIIERNKENSREDSGVNKLETECSALSIRVRQLELDYARNHRK